MHWIAMGNIGGNEHVFSVGAWPQGVTAAQQQQLSFRIPDSVARLGQISRPVWPNLATLRPSCHSPASANGEMLCPQVYISL